jgi:hypothetical protein
MPANSVNTCNSTYLTIYTKKEPQYGDNIHLHSEMKSEVLAILKILLELTI